MSTKGYIYVDAKTNKYVAHYLPRIFMAKGIQEISKTDIIVNAEVVDENLVKVAEMYGCHICVIRKNPIASIKAAAMAVYFVIRKFDRTHVINFKYKKIPVADFLYDTLIRINKKRCTIERIGRIDFYSLYWSFKEIICVYGMFRRKSPVVYLTHETEHLAGCTAMIAAHMGSHIFTCTLSGRIHYLGQGNHTIKFLHDVWKIGFEEQWNKGFPDDFVEEVDRYLHSRTSGNAGIDTRYAYFNKRIIGRDEYVKEFGLDADKKNIVIMCHCFSDTPHMSSYPKLYEDYYIWFLETLKIISEIKNVNWIIKSHPSRIIYGETEEVNELFTKYDNGVNMWLWDDGDSTESLFAIADAVITVSGTCGLEFPCYGIPVIATGCAYYSGHGCLIMPRTIAEYKKILNTLDQIKLLDEEKILTAKKIMYTNIHIYEPFDEVDQYLSDVTLDERCNCDSDGKNKSVMEYLANHSETIWACHFTQEGRRWGKKFFQ